MKNPFQGVLINILVNRRNVLFFLLFVTMVGVLTIGSLNDDLFSATIIVSIFGITLKGFYLFVAISTGALQSCKFHSVLISNGMTRKDYFFMRIKSLVIIAFTFQLLALISGKIITSAHSELHNQFSFYYFLPFFSFLLYGIIALFISHYFVSLVKIFFIAYFLPDLELGILKLWSVFSPDSSLEPWVYFMPHGVASELLNRPIDIGMYLLAIILFISLFIFLFKKRIDRMNFV